MHKVVVRILVSVLAVIALIAALKVSLPTKHVGSSHVVKLPAVAIGQELLYRLEVGVLLFYGGLIVLTPVFRGAVLGKLPIEISARGAKFAEDVDETIGTTQQLMAKQQERLEAMEKSMLRARLNIDQIAEQEGVALDD
jgi:hypothetical protein